MAWCSIVNRAESDSRGWNVCNFLQLWKKRLVAKGQLNRQFQSIRKLVMTRPHLKHCKCNKLHCEGKKSFSAKTLRDRTLKLHQRAPEICHNLRLQDDATEIKFLMSKTLRFLRVEFIKSSEEKKIRRNTEKRLSVSQLSVALLHT